MKQTLQKYALTASIAVAGLASSVGKVFAQVPTPTVDPAVIQALQRVGNAAAGNRNSINVGAITLSQGFAQNLGAILTGVLGFVMAIAALLVFFYLILGGIQWITSGGDKGKTEEARNKITAAIIGLIVLAASYAVLQIMLKFLGLNTIGEAFNKIQVIPTVPAGTPV